MLCLAVLFAFYVGAALGLMFGGMDRARKMHDKAMADHGRDMRRPHAGK